MFFTFAAIAIDGNGNAVEIEIDVDILPSKSAIVSQNGERSLLEVLSWVK